MAINPRFQRLALLTGSETLEACARTRVMVFGVGGVGSWCAEALVRSGIGDLAVVDSDRVCVTNINRQVQAVSSTLGQAKVEALKARLLEINPGCRVQAFGRVFSRAAADSFTIETADYIIDAIDSLTYKLDLIEAAAQRGIRLYASMGMARKLDPTQLKIADIWETQGCALARLVRSGLRKRGFQGHFTVVYSAEQLPFQRGIPVSCGSAQCHCPTRAFKEDEAGNPSVEWCSSKKAINGSAVPVTAAAGMILASLVIRDIYARYTPEPEQEALLEAARV
ncbi:MAG: tRNA threonylcarbamoyladenosine dehydratase [Treponema sp.]|jgi:tRNA A37 threonylcarbamoyladenosine dehydratase|nr:tRNA threonylcarbamoyladenosine dehydratase [Treponema sp.]